MNNFRMTDSSAFVLAASRGVRHLYCGYTNRPFLSIEPQACLQVAVLHALEAYCIVGQLRLEFGPDRAQALSGVLQTGQQHERTMRVCVSQNTFVSMATAQ